MLCFFRWSFTTARVIVMAKCWMTPGPWEPTVNLWSWFWARSSNWLCGRGWSSPWDQAKCPNLPAILRLPNWFDWTYGLFLFQYFVRLLSTQHCTHWCPSLWETSVLGRIPWKARGTAAALRRSTLTTLLGTRTWMNFRPTRSPLSSLLSC